MSDDTAKRLDMAGALAFVFPPGMHTLPSDDIERIRTALGATKPVFRVLEPEPSALPVPTAVPEEP